MQKWHGPLPHVDNVYGNFIDFKLVHYANDDDLKPQYLVLYNNATKFNIIILLI